MSILLHAPPGSHRPLDERRCLVERLAANGLSLIQIADALDITADEAMDAGARLTSHADVDAWAECLSRSDGLVAA